MDFQVLVRVAEIKLHVVASTRRCATVLVTTALDGDADFVFDRIFNGSLDVVIILRSQDVSWIQVMNWFPALISTSM